MARKRRPDPAALVIAIAIIAGAILLNVAVFGIVILLAGLIYCWLRERRPEENPTARLSPDHYSDLELLNSDRESLDQRRANLFAAGQELGLQPRADGVRFDARNPDARELNRELDEIDRELKSVISRIRSLNSEEESQRSDWEEMSKQWRFHNSGKIAFAFAIGAYIVMTALLYLIYPNWLYAFSSWASRYIWYSSAVITPALYGAAILASVASIVIVPAAWVLRYATIRKNSDD